MKEKFENTINAAVEQYNSLEESQQCESELEKIITKESINNSKSIINESSPAELTNYLMMLEQEYGINSEFVTEMVTAQPCEKNIEKMFSDAYSYVLMDEIRVRTGHKTEKSKETRDFYADLDNLESRIEAVPTPSHIIKFLVDEARQLVEEGKDEHNAASLVIDEYREPLYAGLDPAQQAYFITETAKEFEGHYTESGQFPDITFDATWDTIITSGHLWHHLEGIITTELSDATPLPKGRKYEMKKALESFTEDGFEKSENTEDHELSDY